MMKSKIILFAILVLPCCACLTYGNSTPPDNPFSSPEQAQSILQEKFKDFLSHPTIDYLRQIDYLVKRVPTEEAGLNGVSNKDIKFILMLQFVTVIDSVWENKKLSIGPYPLLPPDVAADVLFTGEDPSAIKDPTIRAKYIALINAHKVDVDYYNFQTELGEKRHVLSKMIPIFIKYNYTSAESQHWQDLVRQQLQNDPKSKDLLDLFLGKGPATLPANGK